MSTEHVIFWITVVLLAYTYIGYPIMLRIWAALRAPGPRAAAECFTPSVSLLVVAHNEAAGIEARLENLLALDYPVARREILVASDGSTDDTAARAGKFRDAGVMTVAFHQRRGKSAVLNDLVARARGDIVVFADARQRFAPGALRALATPFADPAVGAVSGELILTDDAGSTAAHGVGFYWTYEKFIRRHESRVDSTVGATGAIYAIRRSLFAPIPDDTLLDDVLIPLRIARQGYRVLFEPGAGAYDRMSPTAGVEFMRKVRTIAGNFQLFARERWLMNPFVNRLWVQTISHKGCRLLSPLCLGAGFVANLLLIHEPFYRWALGAQIVFYVAAIGGHLLQGSVKKNPVLSIPYAFCLMNCAAVLGFFRFVSRRQPVTWERVQELK